MNKSELIDLIAETSSMTKADSKKALEATIDAITAAIKKGEDVSLIGFGSFSVKTVAAHEGVNPFTKEKMQIPEKKQVKFKAAKGLAD